MKPRLFDGCLLALVCAMLGCIAVAADSLYKEKGRAALCRRHLSEIGRAVGRFKDENRRFPKHAGELYPQFLTDLGTFVCPDDSELNELLRKPRKPFQGVFSSYRYQYSVKHQTMRSKGKCVTIPSFAEAYAKRAGATPLALCNHHRNYKDEIDGLVTFVVLRCDLRVERTAKRQGNVVRWSDS